MYIRRRAKKYECLIRYKGARFKKSFERKASAVRWGYKYLSFKMGYPFFPKRYLKVQRGTSMKDRAGGPAHIN